MSLELILQILFWILSPGFIVTLLLLLYRSRPKRVSEELILSYIDDETGQKIEQRRCEISWGRVPLWRKLRLIEIPKAARYEITFNPIEGLESPIPFDCYTEKTGKIGRLIFLTTRDFFGRNRVRHVFLLVRYPISLDYRDKISKRVYPMRLEILNDNPIEVRNFRLQIPTGLELEKLVRATRFISDIRIDIPAPLLKNTLDKEIRRCREAASQILITIIVEALPPKQGDTPGRISVELS